MGQTIVYTDEAGNATTIDLTGLETLTSISIDDAAGTITYVDEDLNDNVLDLRSLVDIHETLTTITVDVAGQTVTYLDEDNLPTTIDIAELETTTTVTNTVAGNPIATYTNEEDADVVINETITTLDTMGQTIVYTDEAGNATTIDLTGLELSLIHI